MTVALLFDIDSTLTPPRQPITAEMTGVLQRLRVPFHVAAGSHLALLEGQFFRPIYEHGFQGQFDAFISNGAIQYRCSYAVEPAARERTPFDVDAHLKQIASFDIQAHLGAEDYDFLIQTLRETLQQPRFVLPDGIQVQGEQIAFRGSMVNLAPIGRAITEKDAAQRNRARFVEFDRATGYRQQVLDYLSARLARLVAEKGLEIMLGGQTSFDIGVVGQNKSKAVRTLLQAGVDKVVFYGDALYEGGNDAVIREYVESWPGDPLPVELIQVESDAHTRRELYRMGFVEEEQASG